MNYIQPFYCGKMFSTQPILRHSFQIEKNLDILRATVLQIGDLQWNQDSGLDPTMIRLTNTSCHSISPSPVINIYFVPF